MIVKMQLRGERPDTEHQGCAQEENRGMECILVSNATLLRVLGAARPYHAGYEMLYNKVLTVIGSRLHLDPSIFKCSAAHTTLNKPAVAIRRITAVSGTVQTTKPYMRTCILSISN